MCWFKKNNDQCTIQVLFFAVLALPVLSMTWSVPDNHSLICSYMSIFFSLNWMHWSTELECILIYYDAIFFKVVKYWEFKYFFIHMVHSHTIVYTNGIHGWSWAIFQALNSQIDSNCLWIGGAVYLTFCVTDFLNLQTAAVCEFHRILGPRSACTTHS